MQRDKPPPIICPACHGENPGDAVFCANPACHKALGEFRYVIEEVRAESSWITRLADRINSFTGRPHFVTAHLVWFAVWILLNSSLIAATTVFDPYPYGLLGIVLAIEATLITSFLLISNNRQNAHAEKRAELDYEVNVRTYRHITELVASFDDLVRRIEKLEQKLR